MLTYTHNHAPGILLWQCFCHRNEKQNSESFFNYDANLTSVITMELKYFSSLRCWFHCMTSLALTSSSLKISGKFLDTTFKFLQRPLRKPVSHFTVAKFQNMQNPLCASKNSLSKNFDTVMIQSLSRSISSQSRCCIFLIAAFLVWLNLCV